MTTGRGDDGDGQRAATATPPASALAPAQGEWIARARGDLRMGGAVVLEADGAAAHARAALVLSAETLGRDRLAAARALGRITLALTARRAATLKARAYDGDLARVVVPAEVGPDWLRALADPAEDLARPLKGPLRSLREGPADLHRAALALCKGAGLLPAAAVIEGVDAAALGTAGLVRLPAAALAARQTAGATLAHVASAQLPLAVASRADLHVFRPDDGGEEHYALEVGRPDRAEAVLARLHSACFTGDLLGSLKCDCGPQLRGALAAMGEAGSGLLLYLNQEGRGIGLANKLRAYALQGQGFDTVEANHRLGFEDDERDFRLGAALIRRLGFSRVRLLTNNPAKVAMLQECGVEVVERVPLSVGRTEWNAAYLATKAAKSGHIL